jgi:hypothetical protein
MFFEVVLSKNIGGHDETPTGSLLELLLSRCITTESTQVVCTNGNTILR